MAEHSNIEVQITEVKPSEIRPGDRVRFKLNQCFEAIVIKPLLKWSDRTIVIAYFNEDGERCTAMVDVGELEKIFE